MSHPHHALGVDSDDSGNESAGTPELERVESGARRQYGPASGASVSTAELLAHGEEEEGEADSKEVGEEERLLHRDKELEEKKQDSGDGMEASDFSYGAPQRRDSRAKALRLDTSRLHQRKKSLSRNTRPDQVGSRYICLICKAGH